METSTTLKTFRVPNIGCDGCLKSIVNELKDQAGVQAVSGDVNTQMVTVQYAAPMTWERITESLNEIEYPPEAVLMP